MLRRLLAPAAVLLALAGGGAAAVVFGGLYEVAADRPHWQITWTLLETALHHSVRRRARDIEEPALDDPALVQRGAACFRDHCAACHGAPGVAPLPIGLAMQPLPGPLVDASAAWRPRELAWITRHGIRMSGMPAWQGRLADADVWAVVAFVRHLPTVAPAQWQALQAPPCALRADEPARDAVAALHRHGCAGCHVIPGVVGSDRHVGPPLAGFGRRELIAGRLPNTPQNLQAWLRDPHHLKPGSAMPATGAGAADARLMADYLHALK